MVSAVSLALDPELGMNELPYFIRQCATLSLRALKAYIFLTSVEIQSHTCSFCCHSFLFVCCSSPPNTGCVGVGVHTCACTYGCVFLMICVQL